MNGIEKITEKIAEDMQSQIDEILRKAQDDAKQIEAKYIAEAEISCAKIREKGEQIASESASRARSSAELEARKTILAKKQALVGLAFDKALENPDTAVLLITEKLVNLCPQYVAEQKINNKIPLIVELPDRHGSQRPDDYILSYVKDAVGVKL